MEKIVEELHETEESYVQSIDFLIQNYLEPLRFILEEDQLKQIFSNILCIRNFNGHLLEELHQNKEESVATIFLRMSPFLRLYGEYCFNFRTADVFVKELMESNPQFKEICLNAKDISGLCLSDFLIKPVQRLCQYPLLFREMIKYTSERSPEYQTILKVIELLSKEAETINLHMCKTEQQKKVFDVERMLVQYPKNFVLIQPSRTFIVEAQLSVYNSRSKSKEHIFLFSDSILFTEDKQCRLVFKRFFMLDSFLEISDCQTEGKFQIGLKHCQKESYILRYKDKENRDFWLKELKEGQAMQIKVEARRKNRETLNFSIPAGKERISLTPDMSKKSSAHCDRRYSLPIYDRLLSLNCKMRGHEGICVKDRKYHFRVYTNCFVGREAVDWILSFAKDQCDGTREGATKLLQEMLTEGYFKHVVDPFKPFIDGYYFYRFKKDNEKNLNVSIPWVGTAREPGIVSAELLSRIRTVYLENSDQINQMTANGSNHEKNFSLEGNIFFDDFVMATSELQKVQLSGVSPIELLCFWINIYNTLALHAHAHFGFSNSAFRVSMFEKASYDIGGLSYNMLNIEHSVLRANLSSPKINFIGKLLLGALKFKSSDPRKEFVAPSDPRILFLLNCGAASQPPIRILRPSRFNEIMTKAAAEYLTSKILINEQTGRIQIPQLLEWYLDDFGHNSEEAWTTLGQMSNDPVICRGIFRMLRKELTKEIRDFKWDFNVQLEGAY